MDEEVKVIKAFKGILNKLTPNIIDRLTGDIKKLELNTESRLQKMITTLFDKTVDEPMYAEQYAMICVSMSKTEVEGVDGKSVNFRKLLLTQCQHELEKDKSSELNQEERLKEIEAEKDEDKKKSMSFDLEQGSVKIRRRSNGNIRFIRELYKLGMLTDRIVHQCIIRLVKDKHDDSCECLCKLMTTIGQKLETAERGRGKDLSQMFNDFSDLANDKSLQSRIRFMLQDLIDMRNIWVNTRTVGQANPKAIEEVHKQARQQQVEEQAMLAQAEDRRRNERGADRRRTGGGRGGGGGMDGGRGSQGGDGWNTVSRGRLDASRALTAIVSDANQLENNQLKMGPGGGSSWSFGSKVGSGRRSGPATPAQPEVRTTPNMFGMLQKDGGGAAPPPMWLATGGGRAGLTRGSTGREGAKPAAAAAAPAGPATKDDVRKMSTTLFDKAVRQGNRDVKFKESENAWKASHKAAPGDMDEEVKVIKAFKGILNKLTPNNINRLRCGIWKLKLNTESWMQKMTTTLFDQAVDDPMYAEQYAMICVYMSKTEVEGADGKSVNFRKLLLTQCQREFKKDKSSELNLDERLKEIEAEKDEDKKKKMNFHLWQESTKIRRRSNGNIRFIGELYKQGMLTDRIMHQCIIKLVKDKHDDSYECLCKLMTTIGQKLETAERGRGKDLSQMFNDFSKLANDKSLQSRIRFMLQDLIDMRNNWVNTHTINTRRCRTVSRGRFDASRVLTTIGSGASQLKMGPGGSSLWSFGWAGRVGSGRRSGPAAPAQPEVRTTPNMFGMLQEDGGGAAPPPMRFAPGGRRAGPTRGSTGREGAKPAAAAAGPALKGPATMDDEKMKGTVRLICDEFIDIKDFKAAIQDVEEKLHADTMTKFVGECLNKYVDARSTEQRHMTGELHRRLLESGHLSADAYLAGAKELLEFAGDLACDIPSLWANLGELLAPPLTDGKGVTLASLATPAATIVADNYGGKFVTSVLKRMVSLNGADKVRALVPADFDWKLYFGSDDHVQPLVNSQLGFLVAGANVPLSVEEAPPSKALRGLLRHIQQEADIEAWVKRNVPETDRHSAPFVKDFVGALCFSCIVIDNGAKKVLLKRLEQHGPLLKCLIVSDELELAALYGLLALVRHLQYPPGVLDQCFRQLYDMEVISKPAFLRWREGKDPAEQEGMGVALSGLQAFFKALEEDDDDGRT